MSNKKKEDPVIDSVRTYQAVTFDKVNQHNFSSRKTANRKAHEITINKDLGGVEIKSDRDHILVPFTNISAVYFRSAVKLENIENRKKEDSIKQENSKSAKDTANRPI